ncbi:MAG: phosphotransferase [Microthrixaceae bacterium]
MHPQGTRIEWEHLPVDVQARVADALGSPVRSAQNQPGGFSPGLAARCSLADGRRCFVKAVSYDQNAHTPDMHRREALVATQLPAGLPVPKFTAIVDDGHWVVLVFETIDGRPPSVPWSVDELAKAFAALDGIAAATTPCPIPSLPTFAELHGQALTCYRRLAAGDRLVSAIDPWTRRHLSTLAALEDEWEQAATGDSLVHADVRADNILMRPDGSVVLVDWPHACAGPAWVDKVAMLPSVGLDGGPSPHFVERLLNPLADADPEAVDRLLVAITGYFVVSGLRPDPPGLPTLRSFQRAQGEVAQAWLADRLGLS